MQHRRESDRRGSGAADRLRLVELAAPTELAPWLDALCQGEEPPAAAYVLRHAIPGPVCARVAENFQRAVAEQGTPRSDGFVTAAQIGVTQFEKNAADYLSQSAAAGPQVERLFAGLNPIERQTLFWGDLLPVELRRRGCELAAAQLAGQRAGVCVARSWLNPGPFVLQPHEDAAQLSLVAAEGFEIAAAGRVFASVACVASGQGGDLLLWDLVPDDLLREALGLLGTGYPYPSKLLENIPSVRVPLATGDLVLLDASRIHAVDAVRAGTRITLGRFLGRVAPGRVVWWT